LALALNVLPPPLLGYGLRRLVLPFNVGKPLTTKRILFLCALLQEVHQSVEVLTLLLGAGAPIAGRRGRICQAILMIRIHLRLSLPETRFQRLA
jgi:hypothetical protein